MPLSVFQIARRRALALVFLTALCGAVHPAAQNSQKPKSTQLLHSPAGTTEVGVLDGANYRIDIPNDWNHSLVVFYHGYAQDPVSYHIAEKLSGQPLPMFERHYAVLQSAYSLPGWALPQAYPETEQLRKYFVHKYGQPRETYVAGASMGGALVMVTLELNPKPYLAGLDLCGAVGPTSESFERRFALRAAFDRYFPNLMGPLVPVPSGYEANEAVRAKILGALEKNPTAAAQLRSLLEVHTDKTVANNIAYFTFVIADMQHRAGGNPFDNRNYLYTGADPGNSKADFDLNDEVRRYAANPKARAYLMEPYTPNGRLQRPMLALHTLYDPIVLPSSLALYDHTVQAAGFGENLVQQYVHREGHCNISHDEIQLAFDEMVAWAHHGPRPAPGLLPESPASARQPAARPPSGPAHPVAPKPPPPPQPLKPLAAPPPPPLPPSATISRRH